MKFWEAMKAMEDGKKVTWSGFNNGTYIDKSNIGFLCLGDFYLKDLIGNEWELYEEPVQMFSFAEVVNGMKQGKKYKRKDWQLKYHFVIQVHDNHFFDQHGDQFYLNISHVEATDWIEVKE